MRALVLLGVVVSLLAAGCDTDEASLPYAAAVHDTSETRRAFARVGVVLEPRSEAPGVVATLGDREDVLEVDVFGDPQLVRESGFEDLEYGSDCKRGNRKALRWKDNVRVIVDCDVAADEQLWLSRVERAFRRLGTA